MFQIVLVQILKSSWQRRTVLDIASQWRMQQDSTHDPFGHKQHESTDRRTFTPRYGFWSAPVDLKEGREGCLGVQAVVLLDVGFQESGRAQQQDSLWVLNSILDSCRPDTRQKRQGVALQCDKENLHDGRLERWLICLLFDVLTSWTRCSSEPYPRDPVGLIRTLLFQMQIREHTGVLSGIQPNTTLGWMR